MGPADCNLPSYSDSLAHGATSFWTGLSRFPLMAAEQSSAGKTALTLVILATPGHFKRVRRVKGHAAIIHRPLLGPKGHDVIECVIFFFLISGSLPSLKESTAGRKFKWKKIEEEERYV